MNRAFLDAVVVDTDVLSFTFNRDPIRVPRYAAHIGEKTIYISFATAAEMRFCALLRNWGTARLKVLDAFLSQYEMVDSSEAIGCAWAQLRVDLQCTGRTIERQDAWIAATAIHLNLPLVTHNASHFNHLPLLRVITAPDG